MGAQGHEEHAPPVLRVTRAKKQAQPPLERGVELREGCLKVCSLGGASKMAPSSDTMTPDEGILEESHLGEAGKMAAPGDFIEDEVILISEEEMEVQGGHKVVRGAGNANFASISRHRQSEQGEVISGCDTSRFLGGHGEVTVHQQFGRLAGSQSLPVKVRAPSRHHFEGRVKSGAVYPTSREPDGLGSLGQGADSVFDEQPSTSRGSSARVECLEEELLDYNEEVEEQVMPASNGVVKETPVPKVVWGDRFGSRRRDTVAGSLPRGEEARSVSVGFGGVRDDFRFGMRKGGRMWVECPR
ncbi:hypothetical protein NDU88_000444 [Pleurodeles waltl]|uniref:Uncharacterized protein n=1 Tax=Pleurodeles waltl TaxID=8319 RepID=A0AAV7TFI2_PLEWA|nr:hypothetical protein NDU88_000444 [Pleurodeles waltl]